jgi:ATP-dependent Clp protease ATP-binding subunit ClpC
MYERFSQDARRAVFFADREARQAGSPYLEPEHLLLGLTHEADSKANQLFALAAHAESFRKQLEAVAPLKTSKPVDVPVSNICKRVLVCSVEEADQLGSRQIGTEHLLLGLLRESKSRASALLATAGIDLRSARNRVRQDAGLPILDYEPEGIPQPDLTDDKNSRRPVPAFLLLIAFLLVLYLIIRLGKFLIIVRLR